ncbi:glutamate-1-semialdehyde 2,1-aminomutase [Mailhella massiliensis]|uniref:Glutamate-1-semialdehyde 2,1-aminomutase n=1 Tax=Mailhella massiliensis TaxID=1903261 RepID=A0A921AVU6_9BACT|nr:glutamate-1-semialdehyde 2,1-aminomutase [Mailhella massiliensis]HJD97058.1 glutamate-1-semialdehyde 2,1-aminomutase [Mailhella massiliensis]
MNTQRSHELFVHAQNIIPGGVNSPVRACRNVHAEPLFIAEARGSHLRTVDGEDFIDFLGSWGPMLVGHANPGVSEAICRAALRGTSYGAPCEDEVRLAEKVCEALPSVEMVRMVNSGTEATMSALRLARGVTGRNKMIKFIGGYHGHGDAFLASAGSGVATFSIPGTPGVPASTVADTLLAPYNDLEAVKALFEAWPDEIAALFVEPVAGNMGLMLPQPGFLQGLRELCTKYGALLVFDEVITGFRLSYGGAQERFGIMPDLTTFGKIIGGGLPVGAYGGKAEIMRHIAPEGEVYQAGTLSGNPLAMAAGLATLNILKDADYAGLESRVHNFVVELEQILKAKGVPVQIPHIASLFTVYFTDAPLLDFASVQTTDQTLFESFYKQMREQGIFMAPSAFEANMLSFAHGDEDFARALEAATHVKF